MPSRWQREFTCDWCGDRTRRFGAAMTAWAPWGWQTIWLLCTPCVDRLWEMRTALRWPDLVQDVTA